MSKDVDFHPIALKRTLSYLILGQKGGENRVKIIELLKERPYNINQMAEKLGLNYRTIKHHINILMKHELISSSKTGGYGEVFFLSPEIEGNIQLYDSIIEKMDSVKQLSNFTESPHFFKNVLEGTFEGVIIVDITWDVFFWNKSATRIFDYKNEDILHWPLDIFFDKPTFDRMKRNLLKGKRVSDFETYGKKRSGERIDISLTIDPVVNGDDNVIGYSIMVRDISERKELDNRIKMKKDTLEIIMENTDTGIAYLTNEFNFININSAYALESGHNKEDLIGRNHFEFFPDKENEKIFKNVVSSGESIEVFDKPYKFPDQPNRGITYWNWTLIPVKDNYGKVTSLVLTLKETTTRVKRKKS
jgi:PAS domain S-box-containing protein